MEGFDGELYYTMSTVVLNTYYVCTIKTINVCYRNNIYQKYFINLIFDSQRSEEYSDFRKSKKKN